ncbi:MAG: tripartite tricarboxylate transporter substrate binding protein [Xanthobacteraceae bacterium]|jgi:tripartite-type tricarboxylate transporter receptor subunit TctC
MPIVLKAFLAAPTAVNVRTRRMTASSLFALLTIVLMATAGHAETFPDHPLKIVVPFPAGGPTDVAARLVAQALPSRLGQNVFVENVSGAGGRIGTKAAAGAQPDGYSLLLGGTNINVIMGVVYKNLGFDPIDSFAPIAAICIDSMSLAISPQVPATTFQEFVQYARNNPGKLKYGAPPGIYTHFANEFFKLKTGTDILFVPYKGAAPAITDALGGHIDMVFSNKSTLLTHFKEGKLRALAVTSEARWPELPNTPTMKEVGVDGFPKEVWFGLLAPAGTPRRIVDQINHAVNETINSAEVRASLTKMGLETRIGTAQDFGAAITEQAREWKHVVEATGIKVE